MKPRIVTAFFVARADAKAAIAALEQAGVPRDAVHVLPKHVTQRDDIGLALSSRASSWAAVGGAIGAAVVATIVGVFSAGVIVATGFGTVVAGHLVAALAGAGAGGLLGAIAGGVLGALRPTYEAAYLDDAIGRGGALVAVRCFAEASPDVVELLAERGGRRVHDQAAYSVLTP